MNMPMNESLKNRVHQCAQQAMSAIQLSATQLAKGGRKPSQQRGVSLIIVLVFTLMLAFIAFSQASGIVSLFGGSRNERDLAIARQSAEAALRDGEADATCQVWSNDSNSLVQTTVAGVTAVNPKAHVNAYCLSLAPTCAQMMPTQPDAGINLLGRQPSSANLVNIGDSGGGNTAVNWTVAAGECTNNSCAIVYGAKTGAPMIVVPGVAGAKAPSYYIEVFDVSLTGTDAPSPLFRITALGYGASGNTTIKLQEVYKPCN